MITLSLTPAEHAHILTLLGRGNTSTIRPGEGLRAVDALGLAEKVEGAKDEPDYRQLIINYVCSLSLADHLGDAWTDAFAVLDAIGVKVDRGFEDYEIGEYLSLHHGGVTLHGTSLIDTDATT